MARKLWLTRHGESEYNKLELLGGNSSLSTAGAKYSKFLPSVVFSRLPSDCINNGHGGAENGVSNEVVSSSVHVWTSTLQRTIQTAQHLPFHKTQFAALDEISAGICDGMTYERVAAEMPEEFAARKADKLRYRYPQGESYMDVSERIQPVIQQLQEAQGPVCVVSHQAVLRVLYGQLMGLPLEKVPEISIPLHTLIELTQQPDGTYKEARFKVDISGTPPPLPNLALQLSPAGSDELSAATVSAQVTLTVQAPAAPKPGCSKSSADGGPPAVFAVRRETPCPVG